MRLTLEAYLPVDRVIIFELYSIQEYQTSLVINEVHRFLPQYLYIFYNKLENK